MYLGIAAACVIILVGSGLLLMTIIRKLRHRSKSKFGLVDVALLLMILLVMWFFIFLGGILFFTLLPVGDSD